MAPKEWSLSHGHKALILAKGSWSESPLGKGPGSGQELWSDEDAELRAGLPAQKLSLGTGPTQTDGTKGQGTGRG